MLNVYFRRPILGDIFIAVFFTAVVTYMYRRLGITLPKSEMVLSTISDLSTVSLTLAGFILTLLTVLISFKSSSKPRDEIKLLKDSIYEIFFASNLYFETVKHLKNAVLSLTILAIFGYSLKLLIGAQFISIIMIYIVFSLVIVFLTLWRCLFILSKIIEIQKKR